MVMVDSTGSFHLYNLAVDPGEKEDLALKAPDVYIEMKTRLSEFADRARAAREAAGTAETEADEETIRKLKALGYI